MWNSGSNVERFVQTITNTITEDQIVNDRVTDRLQDVFAKSLEYMDTPRDRQVAKGLIAELTSVKFTSMLIGVKSRQGATSVKKALRTNLERYQFIEKTSQTVRSDLTANQLYYLTQWIISTRKVKEICTIAEDRGRKMKCASFPELATVLQYAFDSESGLEAYPRLTTGTLYRTTNSATAMKEARETILSFVSQYP